MSTSKLVRDRRDGQLAIRIPVGNKSILIALTQAGPDYSPRLCPGFKWGTDDRGPTTFEDVPATEHVTVKFDFPLAQAYPAIYFNIRTLGYALALSQTEGVYITESEPGHTGHRDFGHYMVADDNGGVDFSRPERWTRVVGCRKIVVGPRVGITIVASGVNGPMGPASSCGAGKTSIVPDALETLRKEFEAQANLLRISREQVVGLEWDVATRDETIRQRNATISHMEDVARARTAVLNQRNLDAIHFEGESNRWAAKWRAAEATIKNLETTNAALNNEASADVAARRFSVCCAAPTPYLGKWYARRPKNPTAGFRILGFGEIIQEGDEFLNYEGTYWLTVNSSVGRRVGEYSANSTFQRRCEATHQEPFIADEDRLHNPQPGAGFRILGKGEEIKVGDEVLFDSGNKWSVMPVAAWPETFYAGGRGADKCTIRRKL